MLSEKQDFKRDCSSMRSVGYRQLLAHILEDEDLDESFMKAVFATRQLAKRQLTWLRKIPHLHSFEPFSNGLHTQVREFLQSNYQIII